MLCDNCKKREATVKYEENINGEKKKLNLCKKCSNELGIFENNFMDNMLFSFFDEPAYIGSQTYVEEKCPKCGYHFSDYLNAGLLGCNKCYSAFENKLNPIIKKIQGKAEHVKSEANKKHPINELEKLREKLKNAINDEKYEQAAVIRDKIKDIEKRGEV